MALRVYEEPPSGVRSLDSRIRNLIPAGLEPAGWSGSEHRLKLTNASTVVGQMLPPGVVKGGVGIALRKGSGASRFTRDLDVARASQSDLATYLDELEERLAHGWGGFTGTLRREPPADPSDVPPGYVMQPFRVQLNYRDRFWFSIRFELSADEVGSTTHPEYAMAGDIRELVTAIGLPDPQPIAVMSIAHQIAQKLHACTGANASGTNDRAHDLVDLQILVGESTDLRAAHDIAPRLFAFRKGHTWPPTVRSHDGWDTLYDEAASGLPVLENVESAVEWTNNLVQQIVGAAGNNENPESEP